MARPTKLVPEVEEKILNALRGGSSVEAAARYAGVDSATFHRWMARGHASGTKRADAPYRKFRGRVEEARAAAQVRLEALVTKAVERDWRAGKWLLSCRAPELYGSKPVAEALPEPPAEEERMDLGRLSDEELDQYRHLTRRVYGRDES